MRMTHEERRVLGELMARHQAAREANPNGRAARAAGHKVKSYGTRVRNQAVVRALRARTWREGGAP